MTNKRSYSIADVRAAVERVGASVSAVANELNCSRSTVYAYRRRYPEIAKIFNVDEVQGVRGPQYTDEQMVRAITGSMGIKSAIASRLGCTRQTVDNRLAQSDELRTLFEAERGRIVDLAESKLLLLLNREEPDARAVFFTLKTLGKARGWTERHEVSGAGGGDLKLTIQWEDPLDDSDDIGIGADAVAAWQEAHGESND